MRSSTDPRTGRALAAALLAALMASAKLAAEDWAIVNRPTSPLLDRPSVTGVARATLYPGMRVRVVDERAAPGYARVVSGETAGFMRATELLRGFLPEDSYPGPADQPEPAFLASDRDGDGAPDFRDIVRAARDMIGLPFDDASSLNVDRPGRTPDGVHAAWAADGKDNDGDGEADNRDEDVLVCIDLVLRAVERAGFPLTASIDETARSHPELFRDLQPGRPGSRDPFVSRRVRNVVTFTKNSPDFQYFPEPQIHSPTTFPRERARPGDVLFFGLTKDLGTRKFKLQHSGICVSVDPSTGLPGWMITAVVPRVQFFDLARGYERFTYCGHARLVPRPPAASVEPSSPSTVARASTPR
ncbi:MAG: hypothetical protein HY816_07190 [Candidatus Wallbacteria bacterium]|nr:hypothetical protein [Candidatus Wallbacteria bacterium]